MEHCGTYEYCWKAKRVSIIFRDLSKKYEYIRQNTVMSSYTHDSTLLNYQHDVWRIRHTLKQLDPIHAYLITSTFGQDGVINGKWWKGIYSKSTYYRMRADAISHFLELYDQCM